jgi:hypothetical protein
LYHAAFLKKSFSPYLQTNLKAPDNKSHQLQILTGTPYSEYAVPVEYLPSRDFNPRWGTDHYPPIQKIYDRLLSYKSDYLKTVSLMSLYQKELQSIPILFNESNLPNPAWLGVPMSAFDTASLYCMIRSKKPKIFLEIGSGISTCFAYKAIQDGQLNTKIISIDPHPRTSIDSICDTVIRSGLETLPLHQLPSLEENDIIFMDGSHRSFMNSDVTVFFIDILPNLKPGVIIHIHDVMLPYDYPASFKHWYWNEQYLLAAYLLGAGDKIKPLLPTAFMCRDPEFSKHLPPPIVDLGSNNDSWRGGGAFWFTHAAPLS